MSMPGDRDTAGRLRVGILGAGPVTQAIHLPTLARLSDDFEVRVVMDVACRHRGDRRAESWRGVLRRERKMSSATRR